MCFENSNHNEVLARLDNATEQLSKSQENANKPLFDLMFKLINCPQTGEFNGSKVKVLHTYAHRFMEFYMTECPDGTSIYSMNSDAVYSVANKMRAMGDGLTRLLMYLGMQTDSDVLASYVDELASYYEVCADLLAVVENEVASNCDDCDCDCDNCDCCRCECGDDEDEDDTSWVNEYREDDDAQEYDPEGDENAQGNNDQEDDDMADRLFESLFGFNPKAVKNDAARQQEKVESTPKTTNKAKVKNEELDELARLLTDAFFHAAGIPIPKAAQKPEEPKPVKPAKPYVKPTARRVVVREVVPGFWKFGF